MISLSFVEIISATFLKTPVTQILVPIMQQVILTQSHIFEILVFLLCNTTNDSI